MNTVTRVLAVANQKGGVAKTTTVASLGAAMEEEGRRVLLVDLDPQGCLTFSLGQDPDKLPVSIHEVLLGEVEPDAALVDTSEGMTLLPANIDLAGAEAMLLMRAGREYALKRALANLPALVDVVTSQTVISSDAQKGLGFVPDYQALTAWDEAERRRREG